MKIPYFEAETVQHRKVSGFYMSYPSTTYCIEEDYHHGVTLIDCIVTYRTIDWGLPNEPVCYKIIKDTLKQIGWVDTETKRYFPDDYMEELK